MKVCIFAPEAGPEVETIGFYFRLAGADVIFATHPDGERFSPENFRRVRDSADVRWISDAPLSVDLLIADAFTKPPYIKQFSKWSRCAKDIAFLFPHAGMTTKRRFGHLIKSWPQSIKSKTSVFFGDRRVSMDTISPTLIRRRAFYFPYLHPQSLVDTALRQIFSAVCPLGERSYSIGFMGNKNPKARSEILAQCRSAIGAHPSFWLEYDDHEHHLALSQDQFISTLTQMDFCLCPPGWMLWSHRVVECLCRGAIPILQDSHLYGLGLRDSVNCILVKRSDWAGAVSHALSLSTAEIQQMRRNVLRLRDDLLTPNTAALRFSKQFIFD